MKGAKGTSQEQPFEDYFEQYHSNFYKSFGNVVYDYRSNVFIKKSRIGYSQLCIKNFINF